MPVSDWADLCTSSVHWQPLTGRDQYGKPSYGPAQTFIGRRVDKIERVPSGGQGDGAVVLSSHTVWILANPAIKYDDRISIDDETVYPPILNVQSFPDETGERYCKVMLGRT